MIKQITKDLKAVSNKEKADHNARFFKTGKGEYGEGDLFAGITNPNLRKLAKKYYKEISDNDLTYFLQHEIHEYRLFALVCMTYKYDKADEEDKKYLYDLYLKNTKYINNWDLVDISTPHIVGKYLLNKDRDVLYKLAKSKDLWEQRISIMATFTFIRNNDYEDALKISEMLVNHEHDLIHKAVGWMLREIGKRDLEVEEKFLKKYYKTMPRTMLRYAIEKFEEEKRQGYLKGTI
jgi:3-methyladenine DNA glycosylase AlkD